SPRSRTTRAPSSSSSMSAGSATVSYISATASASVLVLDDEVGAADRSGELRLLTRELETRRKFLGDLHPVGQFESDGALRRTVEGVHHVDRQAALVEHVRHLDVLDDELGR